MATPTEIRRIAKEQALERKVEQARIHWESDEEADSQSYRINALMSMGKGEMEEAIVYSNLAISKAIEDLN